jgi:hypothetical protein
MLDEPVTVVVRRRVKPGSEAAFESAMHEFIRFALGFPGNRGINVVRPGTGSREYTVVDRFADEGARRSFKASPDYREWMRRLRELSESDPYIEEQSGLGGWFAAPSALQPSRPAEIKMALVTFLGVYPLTSSLPPFFAWLLPGWHPLLVNVVVTGLIVAALTWAVMPLLTRVFSRWLFGRPA